jgi:hypothetical protein
MTAEGVLVHVQSVNVIKLVCWSLVLRENKLERFSMQNLVKFVYQLLLRLEPTQVELLFLSYS